MIDTATRKDLSKAVDEVRSKAVDAVDAAKDGAERARTSATSVVSKALDEGKERARSGAAALSKAAQDRADDLSDTWAAIDPVGEVKDLAIGATSRAGEVLSDLGKVVTDNAAQASDRLSDAYDNIARGGARSMKDTAALLDSSDLEELGKAVRTFIRKNPALTIGVAAVAGYLAYRRLKRAKTAEAESIDETEEAA